MLMQFRSEGTTFLFDAVLEESVLDIGSETVAKEKNRGVRLDKYRRNRREDLVRRVPFPLHHQRRHSESRTVGRTTSQDRRVVVEGPLCPSWFSGGPTDGFMLKA